MFGDPISVQSSLTSDTLSVELPVIDTDNGRVVRQFNAGNGVFAKMLVAHTATRENGPLVPTDRTVVRFDLVKPNPADGKPITAFAQFTMGAPRSQFVNADVHLLAFRLMNFLRGKTPGIFVTSTADAATVQNLNRLLNGES